MTPEKDFSTKLRRELEREGWEVESLETALVQFLPDLFAIRDGRVIWLEVKRVPSFRSKVPWRPGQAGWLSRYTRKGGGEAYMVIQGGPSDPRPFLAFPGAISRELEAGKVEEIRDRAVVSAGSIRELAAGLDKPPSGGDQDRRV